MDISAPPQVPLHSRPCLKYLPSTSKYRSLTQSPADLPRIVLAWALNAQCWLAITTARDQPLYIACFSTTDDQATSHKRPILLTIIKHFERVETSSPNTRQQRVGLGTPCLHTSKTRLDIPGYPNDVISTLSQRWISVGDEAGGDVEFAFASLAL